MVSAEKVKIIASKVGFSCCGIARCRELSEQKKFLDHWLDRGYNSGLNYMVRNKDRRLNPSTLLDGAKTIIVCAVNYKNNTIFNPDSAPLAIRTDTEQTISPKIATYALAIDYHITIKRMLAQMVDSLKESCPTLRARTFTDTAPLLEKAWAAEAGLGWIGRNSLLITPQYGSLVLLGEIVMDAEVDIYDNPYSENHCGECRLCIDSCPNRAIISPRVIDTGRCISRLTIEREITESCEPHDNLNITTNTPSKSNVGDSPDKTPTLDGWIFGCDVCQRVCPHNRHTPEAANPDFAPVVERSLLTREFWLTIDPERFKMIFGSTPISRTTLEAIQKRVNLLF